MRKSFLIKHGIGFVIMLFLANISAGYSETPAPSDNPPAPVPEETLALHVWDRYVRRFRRDHNLSLSFGYAAAKWQVGRFGDVTNKNYWVEQISLLADYTFHILISGKTGYFLGSSTGYVYAKPEKLNNEFQPSPSWLLPGVKAGFVYNYDPSGRFFAGVGAQLERFNDLKTRRTSGEWQNMSITGESFHIFAGVDLFFAMDKALHLSWVDMTTYVPKPDDASVFLVNSKISRRVQGGEIGLLIHFL